MGLLSLDVPIASPFWEVRTSKLGASANGILRLPPASIVAFQQHFQVGVWKNYRRDEPSREPRTNWLDILPLYLGLEDESRTNFGCLD